MKKWVLFAVCLGILFSTPIAFCYDINDAVSDQIGDRVFDLYGINAVVTGGTLNLSIFSNYPEAGKTVGSWATFSGDLAIDANLDGIYEYGVALTSHDDFIQGSLYDVTGWYLSDDYALSGYTYNKNQIVALKDGTIIEDGTVTWSSIGTGPDWQIDIPLGINSILLNPQNGGDIDLFFASATCANDYLSGRVHVTPEPISSALFLFGGAALMIRTYRKRKTKFERGTKNA